MNYIGQDTLGHGLDERYPATERTCVGEPVTLGTQDPASEPEFLGVFQTGGGGTDRSCAARTTSPTALTPTPSGFRGRGWTPREQKGGPHLRPFGDSRERTLPPRGSVDSDPNRRETMKTRVLVANCVLVVVMAGLAGAAFGQPQPVPLKAVRELDQASYVDLARQWRQFMDAHGETGDGLVNLGLAYEYGGEGDAAMQAARRAVEIESENPRALAYFGKLLSILDDDQAAALAALQKCRRLAPDYGFGLTMLAIVEMKLGQLSEAQGVFKTIFDRHTLSRPLQDYGYNMLTGLPQGAVLVTGGDSETFAALAIQAGMGFRTDVAVLNISLLNVPAYATAVFKQYPKIKPDYNLATHELRMTSSGPTRLDAALIKKIVQEQKAPVYFSASVPRERYSYVPETTTEGLNLRAASSGLSADEAASLILEKYRLDSATDWTEPWSLAPGEAKLMSNYAVAMVKTAEEMGISTSSRQRLLERAGVIAKFHDLASISSHVAELRGK